MNRFRVVSCIDFDEGKHYEGPVVIMACSVDPSFMLFFPVAEEQAEVINYVLNSGGEEYDINSKVLGIYRTMVDSWKAGNRFLSGVIMDTVYDKEIGDDILCIRLALADNHGDLDSLVQVNFLHAILLAAMERTDVIVSDQFLFKMMPKEEGNERPISNTRKKFPEDKDIINIANRIMSGTIKKESKKNK